MYYLFVFVLLIFLGFFRIPVPGVTDVLYFILLSYSIVKYVEIRKTILPAFSRIAEFLIIIFAGYYSYCLLSADAFYYNRFFNLRNVYPVGFYFIAIVFANSEVRITKIIKAFIVACLIGGVITIIQSLYGSSPMFDPLGFYNIGHWPGQMGMVGSISRVMLPTIYSIYILYIALLFYYVISNETRVTGMLLFLLIPIFISFARSYWMSIIIVFFLGICLLIWKKVVTATLVVKKLFFVIIVLILGISILPYIAPDLKESVSDRFFLTFEDVENKSGTLEYRLESSAEALLMWSEHIWTGIDPFLDLRAEMPELSDVGYTYVLVTIGLIGFILLILIWISQIILSFIMLGKAVKLENNNVILCSTLLFASVIFWIITQQYLQFDFTMTLTFFIYGFAVAVYNEELRPEEDEENG